VKPDDRLTAARGRLLHAESQIAVAAEVRNRASFGLMVAERDLKDAQRARSTTVGLAPLAGEAPRVPNVAAARDAYATADARFKKADRDVRAASREVEAAKQEIEAAREALADGNWLEYARMRRAEAAQHERAAAEARREAETAEAKQRIEITHLPIAVLNRMAAGDTR
jgi:hypothetical protein